MTEAFRWTKAQTARLKADYQIETAGEIAARMGVPRRVVSRKISQLGLWDLLPEEERLRRKREILAALATAGLERRGEGGQFIWTPERQARLRELYLVERKGAGEIAKIMGCRPQDVSCKACALGLGALRPKALRAAEREDARRAATLAAALARAEKRALKRAEQENKRRAALLAAASARAEKRELKRGAGVDARRSATLAAALARAGRRALKPVVAVRECSILPAVQPTDRPAARLKPARSRVAAAAVKNRPDDSELIARALAAGKITVLPPGHACGTTRWEAALHTVSRPPSLSSDQRRQRDTRRAEAAVRAAGYAGGA